VKGFDAGPPKPGWAQSRQAPRRVMGAI